MMRIHTINKLSIILIFSFFSITSCTNEKVCNVDELVQRVYAGEDISVFENALNCKVGDYSNNQVSGFSNMKGDIRLAGMVYINRNVNPMTYLWFYRNNTNYKQGMIVLMLHRYKKGKSTEVTHSYYLKDYKLIPGFSKNFTMFTPVNYGEPTYTGGGHKLYEKDESIYGIYAYEGKSPPYYKEIIPKYLVHVENDKLVVEEPKDDKYFIYRIPEL